MLLAGVTLGLSAYLLFSHQSTMESEVPNLIVVSFDGFRYDYLNNPRLTPNLRRLIRRGGVTGHMVPTFTTKTFPNHHSIATGLYQETHGIIHNDMFDPIYRESFKDKEDGLSDRWWDNGFATPLYIANQVYGNLGRSSCCAPWIGCHVRYLSGKHRAKYHRGFNASSDWYEQMDWALSHMTRPDHPANLIMLYIHQPDGIGHMHGPWAKETLNQVAQTDHFVGDLLDKLRQRDLLDRTNVIFLSDHGLSEINPTRAIVLENILNSTWYKAYGGNPVYHIEPLKGYRQAIMNALEAFSAVFPESFDVYWKEAIPARYRYRHNRRIHSILLVARDGWSVYNTHLEFVESIDRRGQHGYDNLALSMRPLFGATGPAFKSKYLHPIQFTNVDLYPLMLTLLNIDPDEFYHQGDFSRVKGMLVDSE